MVEVALAAGIQAQIPVWFVAVKGKNAPFLISLQYSHELKSVKAAFPCRNAALTY